MSKRVIHIDKNAEPLGWATLNIPTSVIKGEASHAG